MFIYLSLVVFFAAYRNEKALKCKPSPVSDGHGLIIIQVARQTNWLTDMSSTIILRMPFKYSCTAVLCDNEIIDSAEYDNMMMNK